MKLPTTLPANNPMITLQIDALTAFCMIAQIQLSTRHRSNTGESRHRAEAWARMLQQEVARVWPDFREVLELGWDPAYDQPVLEVQPVDTRPAGFYIVKWHKDVDLADHEQRWTIGKWIRDEYQAGYWYVCGEDRPYYDKSFDVIGRLIPVESDGLKEMPY